LLPNVNLQGKDVTNVASNRWDDSSMREKSVVEIGKLPNVKGCIMQRTQPLTMSQILKRASLFVLKKRVRQNIYELALPLFEQTYYIYVTVY
jgi:hypothetical protein